MNTCRWAKVGSNRSLAVLCVIMSAALSEISGLLMLRKPWSLQLRCLPQPWFLGWATLLFDTGNSIGVQSSCASMPSRESSCISIRYLKQWCKLETFHWFLNMRDSSAITLYLPVVFCCMFLFPPIKRSSSSCLINLIATCAANRLQMHWHMMTSKAWPTRKSRAPELPTPALSSRVATQTSNQSRLAPTRSTGSAWSPPASLWRMRASSRARVLNL